MICRLGVVNGISMNKAIFLDRDGTINVEKEYVYKAEDFDYLPGVVDGLRALQQRGFLLIVVTNQSGIARGYYTEEEYLLLEKWMIEDLRSKGVEITKVYHCPHYEKGVVPEYSIKCGCRKPGTELYLRACKEFDIDLNVSYAIGDKLRDLAICKESGAKGILLDKDSVDDVMLMDGVEIKVCRCWDEVVSVIP